MYFSHLPSRVFAGENAMAQLPGLCRGARSAVLMVDPGVLRGGIAEAPLAALASAGIQTTVFSDIPSEPTCNQAQALIDQCRSVKPDCLIAMGGGSVMDIAKLISVAPEGVTVRDLLADASGARRVLPTIMIPTTAGTGAEATPNAIVAVPEQQLKIGIVSQEMIPDAVILDGSNIRSLPRSVAAATGIDALCHAIECYTSKKATPFSDLYAMEALKLIFAHIEAACLDPDAVPAKDAMLLAAYYGGAAIACSGTTAVHALSYPLGGRYHIPHGVSNAIMLLPVMRFNLPACEERFARVWDMISPGVSEPDSKKASRLLSRMEEIVRVLEIPMDLSGFGVSLRDLDELVTAGMKVQRLLQNNLRQVNPQDARCLYLEVLKA